MLLLPLVVVWVMCMVTMMMVMLLRWWVDRSWDRLNIVRVTIEIKML